MYIGKHKCTINNTYHVRVIIKTIQSAKSSGVHIWFNRVLANSFKYTHELVNFYWMMYDKLIYTFFHFKSKKVAIKKW